MEHICVPANETLFLTYRDPWAITDITNVVFIHDVMEFFHHELHNLGFLWRSHYKYVQFSCHWKVENTSKNPSKNISNFNGNFGTKLITTIIVKIKRDAEIV